MKKILILAILCFSYATAICQDSVSRSMKFNRPFFFNADIDYNYQKCNGLELGVNAMTRNYAIKKVERTMEFGLYLSCEYNFIAPKNVFGPKLGLGMDQMLFKGFGYTAKFNLVSYDPGGINDLRFSPEVGLTYLGVINLYYGYNMPLSDNPIKEIGVHKISINLNIGYPRPIVNAMCAAGGW